MNWSAHDWLFYCLGCVAFFFAPFVVLPLFYRKDASAGEAGTATTVQQGVVHEHATRQGDAQGGSHDSTT